MISFSSSSFFLAFGVPSGQDLVLWLLIVLVVFGAKRLPEIARCLGQSVNEFKKAKQEFDDQVSSPSSLAGTTTPPSTHGHTPASEEIPKQS